MKKFGVILIGLLLVLNFVFAATETGEVYNLDTGTEYDEILDAQDKYSPVNEEGEFDFGRYKPFVTKAQVRIDSINLWLEQNVGWMRYIFHMKPEISFLFAINLYVILWFFVFLGANGEDLWFFIDDKGKARAFGFFLFLALMFVRLYYGVAFLINEWIGYIWNVLLPSGVIGMLVAVLVIGVALALGFPIIGAFIAWLANYRAAREKIRLASEVKANKEALDAIQEGMRENANG